MPALPQATIDDLTGRLKSYLTATTGFDAVEYVNAGGSAAVYKLVRGNHISAVKVFDPELLKGARAAATRRRLAVQRKLIGHTCPSLIQTLHVDEAEATAFIVMEMVDWPQLAQKLQDVPADAAVPLIKQLVAAVRYLDLQQIVHRDIKPENIHISNDFRWLKLLDLGVAREFDKSESDAVASTDHGEQRPFLATAQYSSPEYLFRLDAPSPKLWHALNLYQVGAVLHDMICKEPIFCREMSLGNRWLVARAVLLQAPDFSRADSACLRPIKLLATKCLVKDIDARIALVSWDDFERAGEHDPLRALQRRLAKPVLDAKGSGSKDESLQHQRKNFLDECIRLVRTELIATCGPALPHTIPNEDITTEATEQCRFDISLPTKALLRCTLKFAWKQGVYSRTVDVYLSAQLATSASCSIDLAEGFKLICATTIDGGPNMLMDCVVPEIASKISQALDLAELRLQTETSGVSVSAEILGT